MDMKNVGSAGKLIYGSSRVMPLKYCKIAALLVKRT
jgi:hypothetical protein